MSKRVQDAIEARERRTRGEPEPKAPRFKKEPEKVNEETDGAAGES